MDQWPLTEEKIQAAKQLVQEQLDAGHIEPSNSAWNSPIFVIKKKSGKWRLLQDLRKVNETMELMGALQPGLPTPAAIPQNTYKIIIDLKDCFYTIPLNPKDCERFAFSVPSVNFREPMQRYHWKVLPQGMANSPTLCQKFVAQALARVRRKYGSLYLIHYMDDILLAHGQEGILLRAYADMQSDLKNQGLVIAPEKVQRHEPYAYLGFHLQPQTFRCQKVTLRLDHLKTLNDFQKFLGDINWIRPYLKLSTGELKPLFDILKGDPHPNSPRELHEEARGALAKVEEALTAQQATYCDYTRPWEAYVFATSHTPTAVLWQDGVLRWLHLSVTPARVLTPYYELIASLVQQVREESRRYFGKEPQRICLPYTKQQVDWLWQSCDAWGIAFAGFMGIIDNHLPHHKLLQFYSHQAVIFPSKVSNGPLMEGITVFTDGSSNGVAAYVAQGAPTRWQTPYASAQEVELAAVCRVLEEYNCTPLNLYSDSQYIVRGLQVIETVPFIGTSNSNIQMLFRKIQGLLHSRAKKCYFGHLRAHTSLPGPLVEGNQQADLATQIWLAQEQAIQQAQQSHALHHQNANSLRQQYKISRESARQIVKQCQHCPSLTSVPHFGVNPRGLTQSFMANGCNPCSLFWEVKVCPCDSRYLLRIYHGYSLSGRSGNSNYHPLPEMFFRYGNAQGY